MGVCLAVFLGMWVITSVQEGIEVYLDMHILSALRLWTKKTSPTEETIESLKEKLNMERGEMKHVMEILQKKKLVLALARMHRRWYVILPGLPWLIAALVDFLFGQFLTYTFGAFLYLLLMSVLALYFSRYVHGGWSITPLVFMVVFLVTVLTGIYLKPVIGLLRDASQRLMLVDQARGTVLQEAQFLVTEIAWLRQLMIGELAVTSAIIGAFLTVVWTSSPKLAGGRFPLAVRAQLWTILCVIGAALNYAITYFFVFEPIRTLSDQIRSFVLK